MATHIEYTPSSSPAGVQQTISFWMKRSELGTDQCIFEARQNGTNLSSVKFNTNDELQIYSENGGTTNVYLKTNRRFRDVNAWYHIVYAIDTSQGTAADRIKMYVNGVQETSFSSSTYPSSSYDNFWFGIAQKQVIGRDNQGGGSEDFQGLLTHFHYSRGYVYQASTFGSTDSTTGEWKITTSPSGVNYGATGWFILKDGNSVTDQSGNGNNFTVGSGTLTKTEDCPSNVFSTLDILNHKTSACTYSNGGTTVSFPGAWVFALGNMGVSSGKWYWEAKCNSGNNSNSYYGICADMVPLNHGFYNNSQNGAIMIGVGSNGDTYIDGSYTSGGTSPVNNNTDILSLALDLDSGTKTLKIYKNGTLLSTNGTINLSSYYNDTFVYPCFSGNTSSASASFNVNFGNGYFGTTAVSSAGTNASGIGIFEYNVPAGYTAICTKGLNE